MYILPSSGLYWGRSKAVPGKCFESPQEVSLSDGVFAAAKAGTARTAWLLA